MKKIISLRECYGLGSEVVGGKASNIARLIHEGFKVPEGICITAPVYLDFVANTGIRDFISFELGRKNLEDMRWEEMWDASLRIRNIFLKADILEDIKTEILENLSGNLTGKALAVRSSSNFEDSGINSYAGLHESFLNLKSGDDVLEHVKLVWASLWSDAAIAYSRELGLHPDKSMMSVVIQEMIPGKCSGVAFGVSPIDEGKAVIEAVAGLNKGLVDGDVEPDRWEIERATGRIVRYVPSKEKKKTVAADTGTKTIEYNYKGKNLLSDSECERIYSTLVAVQEKLKFIPDIEWTLKGDDIYLLQVRPISKVKFDDKNERRGWDMTLRRSFDNLKTLSSKITDKLIPEMIREAESMEKIDIEKLDDEKLADAVEIRKNTFEKWKSIYWDEFIPFAHGARLFGQIYNDRIKPEDPYEFVDVISADETESVKRNRRIEALAEKLNKNPGIISKNGDIKDIAFKDDLNKLASDFPGITGPETDDNKKEHLLVSVLQRYSASKRAKLKSPRRDIKNLENNFLETFKGDEKKEGQELIDLARASYKLRDDDNVYLGRIESELLRAMTTSRERLGKICRDERSCRAAEEVIMALKMPGYVPKDETNINTKIADFKNVRKRQMRGQPAGKGIGRGPARLIRERADLLDVKDGEIIVCDSIDPEMTFIIPIVGGIIERRGGMLIHGAIIAREYGIPCVTGVEKAPHEIENGEDITIDGFFGLVINHSVGENNDEPDK